MTVFLDLTCYFCKILLVYLSTEVTVDIGSVLYILALKGKLQNNVLAYFNRDAKITIMYFRLLGVST